jgi:hypothetical protein
MMKITTPFTARRIPIALLIALASGSFTAACAADATLWHTLLEANFSLAQSAYSDNWAGGDVGSLTWAANLHGVADKQIHPKIRVENELKLAFGQTHNQSQETKSWASPIKSTDRIRFDTVWKLTLGAWVDPYAAGTFESQFLDASIPQVKRYINPIDLSESAGIARTLYENSAGKAATRFGFGLRQRINKDVLSITPEETEYSTTNDGGIEWVTDWMTNLSKTLTYTTKLTLFKALFYSEADQLKGTPYEDYWKQVDANWDNILSAQVTKIVQVSLSWQLLYDKQIALGGRFRQTLALGINYRIEQNKPE